MNAEPVEKFPRATTVGRPRNLTGGRFGLLVALRLSERRYVTPKYKQKVRLWECSCACGRIWRVRASALLSGESKSCGCAAVAPRLARLSMVRRTKLSVDQVLQIVSAVQGGEAHKSVAPKFGVCASLVGKIMSGQYWGYVTGIERR